ncbi:MAG: type II toxin-antitoxin system VapC family toxin [Trueperaceae bacterium]|nr:type II toxin-antitoxin system VapC family toxin [Trueperaceae bacterium]MCW5819356.1 type II toxin-antitoxin system VapC family toxin [Trueperaceae bacterium]
MSYLLDTNVISEIRKANANTGVRAWLAGVQNRQLFLSVLVVGEIRQGIERLRSRDAYRAAQLEAWLGTLGTEYADRILRVSIEVAEAWGRLNAVRTLPVIDGLLAATAYVHGLTLVTRNTADFDGLEVEALNPFEM